MACDEKSLNCSQSFVERINNRPLVWTIGVMVPTYVVSFIIALGGLAIDPHLGSPLLTFAILTSAALLIMSYHWVFTRFQRTSALAQAIQFFAGLLPVVGGLMILLIAQMASI